MFELGKYYTACPEFTRSTGDASTGTKTPARKMSGKCIHVSPRLVTLDFEVKGGSIRESFRHDEVS